LHRLLPLQLFNLTPHLIAKLNHRCTSDAARQASEFTAWGYPYDVSAQNDSASIVPIMFRLAQYVPLGKGKIPKLQIIMKSHNRMSRENWLFLWTSPSPPCIVEQDSDHRIMMDEADKIWADDKLGRRQEVEGLERFLVGETRQLIEAGFDHAYVLGVDNAYGMGKTWFWLTCETTLQQGYPVAMVDAWADDAGDEPLVALMAAVDEALKPIKRNKAIKTRLAKTLQSVGTILIKGVTGFGAKQVSKLIGDGTLKDIGEECHKLIETAISDGGEEAVNTLGDLANEYAKAAIDGYLTRKNSVAEFKKNLRSLGEAISDKNIKPIFIIIDELIGVGRLMQ
jgi:hypothetical protein